MGGTTTVAADHLLLHSSAGGSPASSSSAAAAVAGGDTTELPASSLVEPKRPAAASHHEAASQQDDGSAAPGGEGQKPGADAAAAPAAGAGAGAGASSSSSSTVITVDDDGDDEPPPVPPLAEGPCRFEGCGLLTRYRCRQCGDAFYCSRTHQRADWARDLPDGARGGHHKECEPRAWLLPPSSSSSSSSYSAHQPQQPDGKLPPPPPKQQEQEQEQEKPALWSGEGNAAKRARVDDEREPAGGLGSFASGLGADGGGGGEGGNPQAMWSGNASASLPSYHSQDFWRTGGGDAGGGGAGTEPVGVVGMAGADTTLDGSFLHYHPGGGLDRDGSSTPMSPSLGGFDGPGVVPAIHPTGYEGEMGDGVGMAAGPGPATGPGPLDMQPPAEEAVVQLMDMGFEEADARSALVLHGNDLPRACDYLLSNGQGGGDAVPAFDSEQMASAMALTHLSSGGGGGDGGALHPAWP